MDGYKRILLLVLIMTVVVMTITGAALTILYNTTFEQQRTRLVETAKNQARLMEAMTRHEETEESPELIRVHILAQIREAHTNYKGFGKTGEITLARREGAKIVFLLRHRHHNVEKPKPVPFSSSLAEPMRRALSGLSGTVVGLDYRRTMVLAAYEPVAILDLGLVAKIDLAEIRAPFIRAGIIVAVIGVLIVVVEAGFFFWVSDPLIKRIRESEERFRDLIEGSVLGVLIHAGGRALFVNQAYADIFGYDSPEELLAQDSVLDHVAPHDRKRMKAYSKARLRGKEAPTTYEFQGIGKDGSVVLIENRARMVTWKDQLAIQRTVVDVTERKRVEEELRKLSSVVKQSPASVVITDVEGTIEYVNEKFTEMTGYSAEEAIGQTPRMLKSGEMPDAVHERLWATIKSGEEWRGTLRNKRKDGTMYLAGVSISPIKATDGTITHFIGAQQDITQRVEDEKRLKQTEKMESIGGLAGGIAHEFNNMLLPIISLTDMTRKALPEDSRERLRLDKVIEAATRAKDLVARILIFSRQEDVKRENIDIHGAIHETMGLLRSTLPTTIKIKQRLKRDTGTVFADRTQIASVLLNLASNAADAMNGKTGEITVSLSPVWVDENKARSIPTLHQGRYARLVVKDDGHGMDEEMLERVTDPFFTTKPVGEGTGLGLSMVHGIVAKHGGGINISSVPGKGTTVEVYLSLAGEHEVDERPVGGDVSGDVEARAGSSPKPETTMEKQALDQ